jgi:hypothetical protein
LVASGATVKSLLVLDCIFSRLLHLRRFASRDNELVSLPSYVNSCFASVFGAPDYWLVATGLLVVALIGIYYEGLGRNSNVKFAEWTKCHERLSNLSTSDDCACGDDEEE